MHACGFIHFSQFPPRHCFSVSFTSNVNRWSDAAWLKPLQHRKTLVMNCIQIQPPYLFTSLRETRWLQVSVLICFIIRSRSKSRDSCTGIQGGEVKDEGQEEQNHNENIFMWEKARDRSPRNAGEPLWCFESPPLAGLTLHGMTPVQMLRVVRGSIWLEPNLGSFHHKNFFWLHDNGEF